MDISQLTNTLNERGIRLWADQGKLRLSAPKGMLTPELKGAIAAHKPALLTRLGKPETQTARTASGLSLKTIGRLIGGGKEAAPVVDTQMMAQQLRVTFRPLPKNGEPSATVAQLRTDLENSLSAQGVTVVPWQQATREFSYSLPVIGKFFPRLQQSMRVVRSDINAVIDTERPINKLKSWLAEQFYRLSGWFARQGSSGQPQSVGDITRQIAWAEDHAIQRLEDPTATQVILLTELDESFVDSDIPYTQKISLGVNTLISQFSEVVIGVSPSQLSILNMNLSDSLFDRENLDGFVARSLIPKIYVPIAPLPLSRFTTGHYNPHTSDYARQLVSLSQSLAETSLLPSGFQLAEVVKRQSHRDIVSAIVNGRSGVSYGFVAYAEPPAYVGPIEISAEEWLDLSPVDDSSAEEIRQTDSGRQYIKTKVAGREVHRQIPDIWLVCSRSGANKTNLDIDKDVIRLGIKGDLHLQVAEGIDLADSRVDIKPSYDTYVMIAIALSAALYTPELIEKGAPIIHFHGYPHLSWFSEHEAYTGTQNPAVPCGTYESGVFNFLSIHQLANNDQRPLNLVGLIEPDHGINLLANNLDYLIGRVRSGTESSLISLGGNNLPSLKESEQAREDTEGTAREAIEQQLAQALQSEDPALAGGVSS